MSKDERYGHRVSAAGGLSLAAALIASCSAEPLSTIPPPVPGALGGSSATRSGPAPIGGSTAASTPTQLPTYGGGSILQPEIVALYWGNFTQQQRDANQTYLQGLATFISGSTAPVGQEPAVFQYGVRGAKLGATWTDTTLPSNGGVSGHAVDGTVRNEIATLQSQGHLPSYNAERVFMVFTSGITFDDGYCTAPNANPNTCFCAYHSSAGAAKWYAVDPFPYNGGNTQLTCGAGGFGSLTETQVWQSQTSHELFEAATDPTAFNSAAGNPGWTPEVGDQCNWPTNTEILSFGAVERIVDKIQNACSIWTSEQLSQISSVFWRPSDLSTALDLFALGGDHSLRHRGWTSSSGWQASWEVVGGTFTSPPVAVKRNGVAGTLDVFAQGTDNSFYHKALTPTGWVPAGAANWDPVGGNFNGQPAVVSQDTNRIEVFGQGTDGSYYHKGWTGTGWPANWDALGGTFNGPPTVVARAANAIEIFGRGIDGSYYHKLWDGAGPLNGAYDGPFPGNTFISEPVVAFTSSRLDVFGQGTDWSYYHKAWVSGSGWQTLEGVSGTYNGPPVAAWVGTRRLDVFGQGTDNAYYHRQKLDGAWGALEAVNGSGFGAGVVDVPSASDSSPALDFFIQGTDHGTYFKTLNGTTWTPSGGNWNAVGGSLH